MASKTGGESSAAPHGELSRELSLFHITMMGLGMMIGAGVFLGIGNAIFIAGPGGVILTFALNGLIAVFTAMSYAELTGCVAITLQSFYSLCYLSKITKFVR